MTTTSKTLPFLLLGVLLAAGAPSADAGGTTTGLAVAVTPDGSRLVAGGSNRVLYELDPETLEVKRRHWYGRQIMDMAFSPDGAALVVESTQIIEWLKADTFEPFVTLEKGVSMAPAPRLDLVAVAVHGFPPSIRLYGFSDGQQKAEIQYDRTVPVAAYGLSPDGKKLALLHYRRQDENEEKVAQKDIPEEIRKQRGYPLEVYKQQHDGYTSRFLVYEVATGKALLDTKVWFGTSGGGHLVSWSGDDVLVTTYHNVNARIDPEGKVTPFELGNSYNYARHATTDGKAILTGGLRKGARTLMADLAATTFECDDLPGFPEYYKAFTSTKDGLAYAGTTAFRVVKIDAAGKIVKSAPVY